MMPTEAFAERGPRRIRWTSVGEGPTLILLPGLGGGSRLFGTLPRRFGRRGFRALAYDPVGISPSSPQQGEFCFEDAADDVWAVADAAGIQRLDLVGTSLGGKVALAAAERQPDRVRRIVLLASSAVVSARARRVYEFFETVAEQLAPESFAAAITPFLFGRTFLDERPAVVDDIARATRPDAARRALIVAQARALKVYDGGSNAGRVRAPTLCIAGMEDTLTDVADVRQTAKLLPAGSYREFARAGHSLLLEDASVYDAVEVFLGQGRPQA